MLYLNWLICAIIMSNKSVAETLRNKSVAETLRNKSVAETFTQY